MEKIVEKPFNYDPCAQTYLLRLIELNRFLDVIRMSAFYKADILSSHVYTKFTSSNTIKATINN